MAPPGVARREPDRRLRPRERLSSSEIRRVFKEGKSYGGVLVVLFLLSSSELDRKVGFVAGRRVGNAVRRNRAKRLLREAFRISKAQVPEHGFHLVLVARHACADADYQDVEHDYLKLLARGGFAPRGGEAPDKGKDQAGHGSQS
jgi:ribonuclease P protein component